MAQRAIVSTADSPVIKEIVDEIHSGIGQVVIQDEGEDVAIVLPLARVGHGHGRRIEFKPTPEQIDALRSAFGGWKGLIDTDELKAQIKAARGSNRPTYKL
ncbi:MAG: hypothetical protein ACRDJH_10015 [Thermomicrobiales bacterium]